MVKDIYVKGKLKIILFKYILYLINILNYFLIIIMEFLGVLSNLIYYFCIQSYILIKFLIPL